MSWTDVFPLLSDEMLDAYQEQVTAAEESQLDELLAVERVVNPKSSEHLVVVSLYRDPKRYYDAAADDDAANDLLEVSEDSWFELRSLLTGAATLRFQRPNITLRVYLSADLEEMVDQLVGAGCEVVLMRGACLTRNPASLWRFLALEEEGRWITITHGNYGQKMIHDVERTEQVMASGLGGWRVPHLVGDKSQRQEARSYRPIHSAHFGAKGGIPTGLLLRALIWHCQRGSMQLGCKEGDGTTSYPMEGSEWISAATNKPHDDFDHWFLLTALYPRLAFEGILTFLIWQRKTVSYWYAVDSEYVTWANPASEILFTRKIVTDEMPWTELPESNGLTIRPDTTVFRRARRKVYEGSEDPDPRKEVVDFTPFEGNLRELLDRVETEVTTRWWIDASPWLRSFPLGSELFLDRRYDHADVVVCGYFFVKLSKQVTEWADGFGLDTAKWREGWNLKLPKLEGPLTLWNAEFSKNINTALKQQPDFIRPEMLLLAWMQQGKAKLKTTTAARMGWRLG